MTRSLIPSSALLIAALTLLAPATSAQTETAVLTIAQTGIGSNGFGTSWRGQDVQLTEDTWLTQIVFQTGSASANIDEVRLMTATPAPTTLRAVTSVTNAGTEVAAVLGQPYLLRGGVRYTVWFHQNNSPNGTYGCDLWRVDATWFSYHTNVDPTIAPGPGEPSYFWAYQYGTNLRLIGYDNLEITGNLVVGGSAQFDLEAHPNDIAFILFALRTTDQPFLNFAGPLRLDPNFLLDASFSGNVGATGLWTNTLQIPANPNLQGAILHTQGFYDANFANGATFSPLETLQIR